MTMSALDSQHPSVCNVGIVADDLTGACDSGVEFLRCSKSVVVVLETDVPFPTRAEKGIIVCNTQSRRLSAEEAYDRTFQATGVVLSAGADVLFKKVDSALRGNFGVEIAAVMDAAAADVAFILPAIPEAGRETIDGVQHIDGVPIAESFYARDPEHPVTESSVLIRAQEGNDRKAGLVSLADVWVGKTAEAAAKLQDEGCQLIVVDARSVSDLDGAVQSLMQVGQCRVFVGCQGLARALAAQLPRVGELAHLVEAPEGPLFFVCGTLHPQSKRQLDVAAESGDVELVVAEMSGEREWSEFDARLVELAGACQKRLLSGKNVAVCIGGEPAKFPGGLCESILDFLSNLGRRVVEAARPAAVVLTGGETAYSVCRALGIGALELHARISPLVVASKVVGGRFHDMLVVTKGGSVGSDDLVSRIHQSLRSGT